MPDDDAAEGSSGRTGRRDDRDADDDGGNHGGSKRRKWTKEEKKNKRGANKGRRFQKVRDDLELCWKIARGNPCEFGDKCVVMTLKR